MACAARSCKHAAPQCSAELSTCLLVEGLEGASLLQEVPAACEGQVALRRAVDTWDECTQRKLPKA